MISTRRDPESSGYYIVEAVIRDQPSVDPFGVVIGDCLHDLRSGLDQLAFELASAHTKPLPDNVAERSEFPIFSDKDGKGYFRFHERKRNGDPAPRSGLAKIEGVDPTAQTIIEGLQPYRRGAAYIDDPLWRLHELGRIDKHRLLHPIAASFWGITLDYEKCINVWQMEGDITCYGGVIENRAVIARVPITPVDARKEVHVEALATLDIAFDRTTPVAAEESISDILGGIYNYILTKVLPPLNPFL